ncbi:hypothetical protein RP29_12915 [Acidovorax temperans]|uniref:Uncharacterized protein n=1 Tax=Acidovorax temperans TaxID=80878 RepID=A0A0D7KA58_9BURK|nr:hypothetical protein RP29_12915 [Acidovorax temperans]
MRSGTTRAADTDRTLGSAVASAAVLSLSLLAPTAAHAVDGCLVLLCFAAPSWKSIPQCVPPIRQVLRDLARGKAFPTCGMSGTGNSARHAWARAPGNCPPQYTRVQETESGPIYTCDYTGAITVSIDGKPFTRTWWGKGGDTVTDFSPVAKSQLGSWDTKYDDDRAAWQRSRP